MINIVDTYQSLSHGVRPCFLSEVEIVTNSLPSKELSVLCGDIKWILVQTADIFFRTCVLYAVVLQTLTTE